jgi:hypothetical protein
MQGLVDEILYLLGKLSPPIYLLTIVLFLAFYFLGLRNALLRVPIWRKFIEYVGNVSTKPIEKSRAKEPRNQPAGAAMQ